MKSIFTTNVVLGFMATLSSCLTVGYTINQIRDDKDKKDTIKNVSIIIIGLAGVVGGLYLVSKKQ